jgi:hypothetical protein
VKTEHDAMPAGRVAKQELPLFTVVAETIANNQPNVYSRRLLYRQDADNAISRYRREHGP